MTKWLEAAKRERLGWTNPTKPTEPTKDQLSTVLSVKSVLSGPCFFDGNGNSDAVTIAIESSATHPNPTPEDGDLTLDAFEERAAIREFDGGLARHEGGRCSTC